MRPLVKLHVAGKNSETNDEHEKKEKLSVDVSSAFLILFVFVLIFVETPATGFVQLWISDKFYIYRAYGKTGDGALLRQSSRFVPRYQSGYRLK